MTDFPLYDVVNHCRICGVEYPSKAFMPQGTEPRFGLCPSCMAEDEKQQAKLCQPPTRVTKKEPTLDYRQRQAGERD
jgi:hypothetical protein